MSKKYLSAEEGDECQMRSFSVRDAIKQIEGACRDNRKFILSPKSHIKSDIHCNKCAIPMSHYMIITEVWEKAVPNYSKLIKKNGHYNLCFWCLEKKLKRKLKVSDFYIAPINNEFMFIMAMSFRACEGG